MNISARLALIFAGLLPAALFASSSTDRQIDAAAQASYNFKAVLDNRVTASCDQGVVTLTGTVPDRDDKALAEDTVSNLPGVVSVDNRIVILSDAPEHSDAWIALKIRGRLLVKANVSAASTQVDVKDGRVTLTGTAQTQAQKELTEAYVAEVDNVKSVRNDLVVQVSGSGDTTVGEAVDDASITAQVKYALFSRRSTSATSTKVTTDNAIVTISGVADSEAEKSLVTALARDTRGVKSVVNQMTVKS